MIHLLRAAFIHGQSNVKPEFIVLPQEIKRFTGMRMPSAAAIVDLALHHPDLHDVKREIANVTLATEAIMKLLCWQSFVWIIREITRKLPSNLKGNLCLNHQTNAFESTPSKREHHR